MSELALKLIAENKKTKAKSLDLGRCGLTQLPDLAELHWLETLIVSNKWWDWEQKKWVDSQNTGRPNRIQSPPTHPLPTGIKSLVFGGDPWNGHWQITDYRFLEKLTGLTSLDISSNQITDARFLEKLTGLTSLYISDNQITDARFLEKLTGLTSLDIRNNQITDARFLEKLTGLTSLDIRNNQITDARFLEKLTGLTSLYISDNQITDARFLEKLTGLTRIDLTNNQLNDLAPFLNFIRERSLKVVWKEWYETSSGEINLKDNPLENPPEDVVKKGNAAILEYFRQKEKSGEKKLLEAKMILLGDGRSGKTSLVNRLLGKELPTEEDRTEGVDIIIGNYEFPLADNETFKLNIWDFAGQDKYKPLHQFFYTESSLYVMVADSGNPKTDFDDWMQTADLFGEGSPMILVLNEFKDGIGMGNFDEGHWKKQFPKLLKEVFDVNLGTKRNLETLEHHIRLLAQSLPHTQYVFPKNWADIRSELESRREENYISQREYFQICKKYDLPERESQLILSSVLHKIGVCLHYQQSELLKQFIILKNEWATEAVYKILEDQNVGETKCGFFDHEDLERIWCDEDYRDMRPQLLELMQQFKLAYPLPGQKEFVTPPLLPPARPPKYIWPENDALELYIEYEFLPKALLTQFIVSRHADINEGRTLVWRNGVVLRWPDEAMAEISRAKLGGKDAFYIRTQGRNRKGMMTVILKTFRDLHGEYKGIKYEETVPCPCDGCRTQKNKQHYFDFANLKNRLEKNRTVVECDRSLEEVNILQLLENTFIFENIQTGQPLALKEKVEHTAPPEEKTIKLFLASSAELNEERNEIEIYIRRKNKDLRKQNIFVDLMIWEDGKFVGNSFRSQDNYNLEIDECDYFVMLFYSKVGKFTKEEFERAKSRFEKEGTPRLRIFQKNIALPSNQSRRDADSRFDFLEELKKEEHFTELYETVDGLVHMLEKSIDKLLEA